MRARAVEVGDGSNAACPTGATCKSSRAPASASTTIESETGFLEFLPGGGMSIKLGPEVPVQDRWVHLLDGQVQPAQSGACGGPGRARHYLSIYLVYCI